MMSVLFLLLGIVVGFLAGYNWKRSEVIKDSIPIVPITDHTHSSRTIENKKIQKTKGTIVDKLV